MRRKVVVVLLLAPALVGAEFVDQTAAVGLTGVSEWEAAWADFDNDGDPDLFDGANGDIWRNDGGIFTVDSSVATGTGQWADFDNDGLLDLFVWAGVPRIYLQRPELPTPFQRVASAMPGAPMLESLGAAIADVDNDGFVDIYVGGYESPGYDADALWYGNGDGTFDLMWTEPTGGAVSVFPARGVTACDFDEDADMDIYVSNYRLEANYLWVNDGSGWLTDQAYGFNVACINDGWTYSCGHTIGSAWGDLDADGDFDLFVGNFSHPDYYQDRPMTLSNEVKTGAGFTDQSAIANIAWQESFASPALADYDNDGDLDLYFTTVYAGDYPVLYDNQGGFAMVDVTGPAGLSGLSPTYQAAWADIDGDGDMDLLTAGALFRNEGSHGNWLHVKLTGNSTSVNTAAIGAQVRVQVGATTVTRQVEAGTGQGNGNDHTMHFGLGASTDPVDVEVRWPDGLIQVVHDVDVNQQIWVDQCRDVDGDGFGDASCGDDCDDTNPAIFPGADELCDGVDNNCDGEVDEPEGLEVTVWYADDDGDGFGRPGPGSSLACAPATGQVGNPDDCDDGNATHYPGADELCDGVDNDCDGLIDEQDAIDAPIWFADADADGFGDPAVTIAQCGGPPTGYLADRQDCDDTDPTQYPGADETCDGEDDDCDGEVDEDEATDVRTWYADADGDGFGDIDVTVEACTPPHGYHGSSADCDDSNAEHHPDADELCDGDDDDCDGEIDESSSIDAEWWYADADGDGFGDPTATKRACTPPAGHTDNAADCDDADPSHFPGATWHVDADGDGFGSPLDTITACETPRGYVDDATDCDDSNDARHPGATETCNGSDEDCDQLVDEGCDDTRRTPMAPDPTGCDYASSGTSAGWVLLGAVLPALRRRRR